MRLSPAALPPLPNRHTVNREPSTSFRIAHLSDVHFGKIEHPGVVDALVEEVNGGAVSLVVVSGDLTQRARREQFLAARAMLDRFDPPVIVVPGNHDVRAWWHNPAERVFRSTRRFRRFITSDRTPTFVADAPFGRVAAFGLNSAHGLTIKGGRIRHDDLAAMEAFFAAQPAKAFRVLVLHHHLLRLEDIGDHDVSRGARRALRAAQRAGVDLVLCGHLHRSHVASAEIAPPSVEDPDGHRLVVASAGTATSSRGRGQDRDVNLYNWIVVEAERFIVFERRFDPGVGAFDAYRETTFARDGATPAATRREATGGEAAP